MASTSRSVDSSQDGETESDPSGSSTREPPNVKDVPSFLEHFHEYLRIPFTAKRTPKTIKVFETVYEDWKAVAELYKHQYNAVSTFNYRLLEYSAKFLKKGKLLLKSRKGEPRRKDEVDQVKVFCAAMAAATAIFVAVSNDFETVGVDLDFLSRFDPLFQIMLLDILDGVLEVESNVGCAMLDVIAAIGNDLYCQLPERCQKQLIVFLLGYGADSELSAQLRAKIGRCLAKLIEFPSLKDNLSFFMDVFQIATKGLVSGESVVKISYAWTFSNLTDAMVESHMATPLEDETIGFVRVLLHTAIKCTQVPLRGRYSACRSCGNIYRWMKLEMLNDGDHRILVQQITMQLIAMVGAGLDYKLRWNAAHALGHALENEIFFQVLSISVTAPIIKTLAKWVAASQNYKERTQCVVSLLKAKRRTMYDILYPYVWDRICLSLSRLPVEDCDTPVKFKIESILLIFHLISLLRFEDLEGIEATVLKYGELLSSLVSECYPEIPLERLGETLVCKDNLKCLMAKTTGTVREECVSTLENLMSPVYAND